MFISQIQIKNIMQSESDSVKQNYSIISRQKIKINCKKKKIDGNE